MTTDEGITGIRAIARHATAVCMHRSFAADLLPAVCARDRRPVALLGAEQRYYRLTERAVRDLAADRGVSVSALVVDPGLVAAPVREPVTGDQSIEREAAQVAAAGATLTKHTFAKRTGRRRSPSSAAPGSRAA